jgi:serine protease Do
MVGKSAIRSFHLIPVLGVCCLLASTPMAQARRFPFFPMGFWLLKSEPIDSESNLVRVTIITKVGENKDAAEINGRLPTDSSPIIIKSFAFSTTGIVLDQEGNIMTYLGEYRWLDSKSDSDIQVYKDGQKLKAKLVGVDQRNGVAIVRLVGGKLKKTPTCSNCELKDGLTIMAPFSARMSKFQQAQIISTGMRPEMPDAGGWIITVDHPFPDAGLPILTSDHRVIGFITDQDPMGVRNTVYPISQLLESAQKILQKKGDIYAGWLGLFVSNPNSQMGPGILVRGVELGSPAQTAGLVPGDRLLKYNGQQVADSSQYKQLVEGSAVGSKANLEITRHGSPMTLTASIGARKQQPNLGMLPFSALGFPFAGLVPDLPQNQKLLIGVDTYLLNPPTGLYVNGIQEKSPAEAAGVRVGDIIVSIDNEPITSAAGILNFLQTHNWGPEVIVRVNRNGTDLTLHVQLANRGN